jgi:hypothetical protein
MYEEAVAALRELTRDRARFPLVFAENVEYGFRRNALGLRWIGLALSMVAIGVSAGVLLAGGRYDRDHLVRWLVPGGVGVACAGFWLFVVTPSWVRRSAELYANRLLESVVTLRSPTS